MHCESLSVELPPPFSPLLSEPMPPKRLRGNITDNTPTTEGGEGKEWERGGVGTEEGEGGREGWARENCEA